MTNWYQMKPNERPKIIDYIAFITLVSIPLIAPLALAKNIL